MNLVSVLIPTRKRVASLGNTIQSIFDRTSKQGNVDILVGIDEDDLETQKFMDSVPFAKSFVGPRPIDGYNGLWTLYTSLFLQSDSEFILIFNDDAVICSQDWDLVLERHRGKTCVICPHYALTTDPKRGMAMIGQPQNLGDAGNIFPIVSTSIPKITGNLSFHSSIDVWFRLLGEYAGITVSEPDIVLMHRGGYDSQHWIDGMPAYDPGGSYKMDWKIREDAQKVKEALGR